MKRKTLKTANAEPTWAVALTADFFEDVRLQLTESMVRAGYQIPTNLDVERTIHLFFNIQTRRIHPRKRKAVWSDTLLDKRADKKIPENLQQAVDHIAHLSEGGEELNRFLSTRLADPQYHDRLLNDWGIHHLHLGGTQPTSNGFIPRSRELLYVFTQQDALYLLDILGHKDDFGDPHLVEVIHRNWPHLIDRFRFQGNERAPFTTNPHDAMSSEEIVQARKMGLQPLVPLSDGTMYGPFGGGISTCGLNLAVAHRTSDLLSQIQTLQQECVENRLQIRAKLKSLLSDRQLDRLQLRMIVTQHELVIVEVQTGIKIGFSTESVSGSA